MYPNTEILFMLMHQQRQAAAARPPATHLADRDADGRRYPAPFRMRRRSMSGRTG